MNAAVCRQWKTHKAVKAIARGGVIAYPTESVWGLGCDPFNPEAISKLLRLKNRPINKGLILVAAELAQLGELINGLSEAQLAQLEWSTTAQPTSWLIPHYNKLPLWITGQHTTVAIRLSNHPTVQALCHNYGGMLVSTSANLSGRPAAATQLKVRKYFAAQIDTYVAGQTGHFNSASHIVDLTTGRRLR